MATLLAVPAVPAAAQQDIEDKALAILEKSRAECHRQNGSTFSGVEIQENLKQLLQARLIIAGDSKNSPLIQVIEKGEMPPPLSPPPIDDLKRLSLKLTAKVFTADASLLGVRDPQNISKMLFSFQTGDELEISDYSAEGKNSGGQTIPKGKYLYVTRVKKEGTEEWLDAKGVIFADAITPTSIDQVAGQTQSSQQPFGSGTIRMNSIDRAIPKSHYRSPELDVQQMELQRFNSILSNQKTI